jgi:UDP-4-amino-4,6-dideoxy-N-acetyl-beta-L-altrosamine transaminase
MALDVKPGDCVWTSAMTFVASANCAVYCGAEVDFVDIDPRTYNMSVEQLEHKLAQAKSNGVLPKVVIPVHFAGQSCDMAAIHELSKKYGFRIIEDASHAVGGRYQGEAIGNCRHSDISVFSFHPVKIITTAEGGMALTNDADLARRMSRARTHGITRDPSEMTREPDGPWYYQQIELGYNYRMTDLHAALGLSQLRRIDQYTGRRHELAKRYDAAFGSSPVLTPWQDPAGYSAFHLYPLRLRLNEISPTHREVFESMREQGIGVGLHYIPVHFQPFYQRRGFNSGDFPEAERYYAEAITLPLFPALTEDQQDRVVDAFHHSLSV